MLYGRNQHNILKHLSSDKKTIKGHPSTYTHISHPQPTTQSPNRTAGVCEMFMAKTW